MFNLLYKILSTAMLILGRLTRLEDLVRRAVAEQAAQRGVLEQILAEVTPPPGAVSVVFNVTLENQTLPGVSHMQIKDTQEFDVTLAFQDAKGKPATVDGVPEWTADNPSVVTLTVAADGLSATVTAADVGSCQVSVSADSDLGAGTVQITGVLPVEVLAGSATVIALNPGEPREQAGP